MKTYRLVAPSLLEPFEVAEPTELDLAKGEVLVKVRAGGICGSDVPHFAGKRSAVLTHAGATSVPGFPMHEVVGEVIASASPDFTNGDLTVGWASNASALAETIRVEATGLSTYPARWDHTEAIMLQPLACAIHVLDQIGAVDGKRFAILGQGPIGLLFSHVAKSRGAAWVTGVDRVSQPDSTGTFGVDEFIHSSTDRWAHALLNEDRPEVVIEAIGHQVGTFVDAVQAVSPHGLVYYFGIPDDIVYPLPMVAMLRKNLTLGAGTVTQPFRRPALAQAIAHLQAHPGLIDAYITDVFGFADAQNAYMHASTPTTGQHKIVIDWGTMTADTRNIE